MTACCSTQWLVRVHLATMAVFKAFLITWIHLGLITDIQGKFYGQSTYTSLPRASARPFNVDPELDCAVKELAWEYAKKLLPQVRCMTHAYRNDQSERQLIHVTSLL